MPKPYLLLYAGKQHIGLIITEINIDDNEDRRRYLTTALQALGWHGKDLAERLDLNPITVSSWRTGRRPVPGYAIAYLDLALGVTAALKKRR